MEYVYIVEHRFDVDGGFGDAISNSETIAVFRSKYEAWKFVEKYSNPVVYDSPYADLYCGELTCSAIPIWSDADAAPEFRMYIGRFDFGIIKPYGYLESDEEAKKYGMTFYRDMPKDDATEADE